MPVDPDLMLAEDMAGFYDKPLDFVIYAYPWDTDPQLQVVKLLPPWNSLYDVEYGPDAWACELLQEVGRLVNERNFDGVHAVDPILESIVSGHGIGKSALVAWLVDWLMSTRPHCQGTVTAGSIHQLSTKTWAQIAKWTKKCVTAHWFDLSIGKSSMKMAHKMHPESWFCCAQSSKPENADAFAGQHSVTSTSFYIFDEAAQIEKPIWNTADGGLTDGEPMMFVFGNGTRNTGDFKDCFTGKKSHRWHKRQIDSRSVQITNKRYLQQLVDDYGIDSDHVKIRVRGMFPAQSEYQFISVEDIDAATHVHLRKDQYDFAPIILTCDPAWTGSNLMVFGLRQGLKYQTLRAIPKNDNDMQVATLLAQMEDFYHADAVFVDAGYGTGIVSAGHTMGRGHWQLVWFAGKSPDKGCLNMRAYMYKGLRDWLKKGGAIDEADKRLYNNLIAVQTVARADGIIQLISKEEMRELLEDGESPDFSDAMALAFAFPVDKKIDRQHKHTATAVTAQDYDPNDLIGKG